MDIIFIIVVIVMSIVVHEVAHGFAALALGDGTAKYHGRLTLNPIKHLDPVGSIVVPILGYLMGGFIIGWAKPVPFNPYNLRNARWGEAFVAAAGPASNLFIALFVGFMIRLSFIYGFTSEAFLEITSFIVLLNITLAFFNLVPIPPLDGSKILFSILPNNMLQIRAFLEKFGLIFALIFILLFWRLFSPLVYEVFSLFSGLKV